MIVTSEPLTIRRIAAGDGPLLRELRLRSLEDSPAAFGQLPEEAMARPDVDWRRRALQASRGDHRTWLFAERGRNVVGLVQGRRRSPATLLLFSMWVDPASRRMGVGRMLIDGLEEWARGWQAAETVLWVFRRNSAALRFYRELGFRRLSSGADADAGARYEAAAMRRAISPLASPDGSGPAQDTLSVDRTHRRGGASTHHSGNGLLSLRKDSRGAQPASATGLSSTDRQDRSSDRWSTEVWRDAMASRSAGSKASSSATLKPSAPWARARAAMSIRPRSEAELEKPSLAWLWAIVP